MASQGLSLWGDSDTDYVTVSQERQLYLNEAYKVLQVCEAPRLKAACLNSVETYGNIKHQTVLRMSPDLT